MKRLLALLLAVLCLAAVLTACGEEKPAEKKTEEPVELIVFAAASMTETLEEIAEAYKTEHPNVDIIFTFDSSGTLQTQIEEGAPCDLFISAAQKQMDALAQGNYINTDTRVDLLENKVALCVASNSDCGITSFDDLKTHLEAGDITMAMGNSDVPVGQYTQKILTYFGLDEETLANNGVLTYGTNVKEVTTQISEGTVDCGIIYQTDAFSANLDVADTAAEAMCGQVIYPAAVLSGSEHPDAAKAFLAYLQTADCAAIFKNVGFTPLASN